MISKLRIEEINLVLDILRQDTIRGYNGKYADTERPWISNFIIDDKCYSFGLYENDKLTAVLLSERLSFNGCIIWYIAVSKEEQSKGFGSKLLDFFENHVKSEGVDWIFLNSSDNSLKFYKDRNYITSEFSNVNEHVKELKNPLS